MNANVKKYIETMTFLQVTTQKLFQIKLMSFLPAKRNLSKKNVSRRAFQTKLSNTSIT